MFNKMFKAKKSRDNSRDNSRDRAIPKKIKKSRSKEKKMKRKKIRSNLAKKKGSRPSSQSSGSKSLDINTESNKKSQIKLNNKSQLKLNNKSQVKSKEKSQTKSNEKSQIKSKEKSQTKLNEKSQTKLKTNLEPKIESKQFKKEDSLIRFKPRKSLDTSIDIKIQIKQSPNKSKENALTIKSDQKNSKELAKLEQFKAFPKKEIGLTEPIDDDPLSIVPFNTLNKSLMKSDFSTKSIFPKLDKLNSAELFSRLLKLKSSKATTSGFSLGKEKSRSGKECRICLQLIEDESNSIQPCACIGSQAFVHKNCLHEWIRIRASNKCDVCNREYSGLNLIKRHRGFLNWITSNPVVFFYLISGLFLGIFFFYVLFIGFLEYKTSDGLIVNYLRIILLVISIFYTILFSIIFICLVVKAILVYLSWREENYTVTLGPLSNTLMTINESVNTSSLQPMIDQMSKNQSNEIKNKSTFSSKSNMPINPSQSFAI